MRGRGAECPEATPCLYTASFLWVSLRTGTPPPFSDAFVTEERQFELLHGTAPCYLTDPFRLPSYLWVLSGNLTDFYAYFLSPKIRHRLRTVFEFRKRTDSNFSLVTFSLVPECRTPAAQISGQATPPRTSRAAPRQGSTHSQAAFPSDSHLTDKLPLGLSLSLSTLCSLSKKDSFTTILYICGFFVI